jgi:hypothetical protein
MSSTNPDDGVMTQPQQVNSIQHAFALGPIGKLSTTWTVWLYLQDGC